MRRIHNISEESYENVTSTYHQCPPIECYSLGNALDPRLCNLVAARLYRRCMNDFHGTGKYVNACVTAGVPSNVTSGAIE